MIEQGSCLQQALKLIFGFGFRWAVDRTHIGIPTWRKQRAAACRPHPSDHPPAFHAFHTFKEEFNWIWGVKTWILYSPVRLYTDTVTRPIIRPSHRAYHQPLGDQPVRMLREARRSDLHPGTCVVRSFGPTRSTNGSAASRRRRSSQCLVLCLTLRKQYERVDKHFHFGSFWQGGVDATQGRQRTIVHLCFTKNYVLDAYLE